MSLDLSAYPEPVTGETSVQFDETNRTLVVSAWLPAPTQLPRVIEHKFVAARSEIKTVEMKPKDADVLYDEVIQQVALRTIHEAFSVDYAGHVRTVVFNGWVHGVDQKTGQPFTSCIMSCAAPRDRFTSFDLTRVSPRECIRGLKGVSAGRLATLAPVQPILELDRNDDRFVDARAVIDHIPAGENLAGMDWEDFEHLVRELFEKEFASSGGEVNTPPPEGGGFGSRTQVLFRHEVG